MRWLTALTLLASITAFADPAGDREKLRRRSSAEVRAKQVMSLMTEKKPGEVQTETAHPLVRTHKDTGRKALYIGGHTLAIDGWTDAESRMFIFDSEDLSTLDSLPIDDGFDVLLLCFFS